ncbi:cyclin-dependent kinase inhibitor 1-like [Spea bombifrons]|uniref:cyclin-dependent kinase inhibitor 1-like n=1 Tax=Spea bombifrons TaxID=233779 RepID=UPI00234A34FD|nr:cyclin-dependent kinase inhibitor 1-like [Spea bombifrons]
MDLAKAILLQASGSSHKVCRNIFGSVDHDQLKADFEKHMKSAAEEAKQRWNFDFANEAPLEGKYKWEKMEYILNENNNQTTCAMDSKKGDEYILNENNNQTTCAMDSKKEDECPEKSLKTCNSLSLHELCKNLDSSESICGKRKQKLITDFYPVKRRRSPSPPPRDDNP